ncbi:hypothetical protein [Melioribacter sp. OK-6-Me]|uniref:hypothetical protein n=1 Tax=unclassified Melioribacter TaxID=2627329 RepID=UPI003ED98CEE
MKFFTTIFFLLTIFTIEAQVILKDTVITWYTFKYNLNDDYTIAYYSQEPFDTVSIKLNAFILENDYLKILLVP